MTQILKQNLDNFHASKKKSLITSALPCENHFTENFFTNKDHRRLLFNQLSVRTIYKLFMTLA